MDVVSPATPSSQPSLWSLLRESIRGSHQDFTAGNLNRAILLLAVPMVLEMALESLFAVVDVFWVAHLGANAVATVGLTESLLSLVIAVGLGLSLSTTAMVARRIGEKDPAGAAVAGVQAIALGLAISLAIGAPCLIFAPDLLRLMGASPAIVAVGSDYARIAVSYTHLMGFDKAANPDVIGTLKAAVNKINALPVAPAFILHTGDISHLSKPEEFDTVDQLLKSASTQDVFFVPGEHDVLNDEGKQYLERYGKGSQGSGLSLIHI